MSDSAPVEHAAGGPEEKAVPGRSRIAAYLISIGLLGILAFVATVVTTPGGLLDLDRLDVAIPLCVVLIAGELRPIKITRGEESSDEVSIASTIGLALVFVAPVGVVVLAQAAALAADELRPSVNRRVQVWQRLSFNVGQYAIAFITARLTFGALSGQNLLSGSPDFTPRMLPAAWIAAVVFYVVNSGLTSIAFALATRTPMSARLVNDLRDQITSSVVLLGLAPVVAQAESWSPWLLPFLLLPLVLVHTSAGVAARREHEALHDALTGLPNRTLLLGHLAKVLAAATPDRLAALLFIDLDHFKEINDTLGHPVGDRLISDVGQRLRLALREGDVLARLGGDEFAVVTDGLGSAQDAENLALRLAHALRDPFEADGIRLDIAFSVGIALAPEHADTVDLLLQRADVALYEAKETRGAHAFYDPASDTHSLQRLALAGDLRRAIETNQIDVYYQPQIDARTRRPVGVEALIRWNHPALGTVDPETVVRLASSTGLLSSLSALVLDRGLSALRRWHDADLDISLAVNLTARQLIDPALVDSIAAKIERLGVRPSALILELTESAVMTDQHSQDPLERIRQLGICLSIDDFGTGFSSLAQLHRLSPHELKIDRTFVQAMAARRSEHTIVASTIELGHNLGMRVVAEGVEDELTAQLLAQSGCDILQGFAFALPRPEQETTEWLVAAMEATAGTVLELPRRA